MDEYRDKHGNKIKEGDNLTRVKTVHGYAYDAKFPTADIQSDWVSTKTGKATYHTALRIGQELVSIEDVAKEWEITKWLNNILGG